MFEKKLKENEIGEIFKILDKAIENNTRIILLQGDLASGKTTLVQQYIKSKNINLQATSPTFNLVQQYDNFYHYDLYHHSLEKFINLGLLEQLEDQNIHFIEWGEDGLANILKNSGYNYLTIKITKAQNYRIYKVIQNG
ncbi:tRNA (adenosine(37)-N6)-threonylcarbamoyltransferase complex ATPase subunit type 1 TsaE [Helicobacter anseris]|uniref:tRNA threonylcarbamoyladenosine biosynthesis protein TsaE n=1 Tax=Helicobacter anseris TaxID=375926 RepID=A0A3D8J6Y6_9HELI|nr:tRNA (adenosine(37)-N6)-threonylcarbamoyltransferase complex ATPase subunit type 1 TsaE [Helicobacter anseris]RDU73253.1 tRNA (adenosine(37)-N6)-threonylcarbamoyltransferase complex ATPase subunit type 1 TsaE [Helicobacter anseris]